jgi:branched-subunit amino acid ABC-type transport system permease component
MANFPTGNTMTAGAAAALVINEILKRVGQPPLDLDSLAAIAVVATYVWHAAKVAFTMVLAKFPDKRGVA